MLNGALLKNTVAVKSIVFFGFETGS